MYNLDRRPPGPLKNYSGYITPAAAIAGNNRFQAIVGSDQSKLHFVKSTSTSQDSTSPLTLPHDASIRSKAPWLAISDNYSSFTRSGLIKPSLGRATGLSPLPSNASNASVTVSSSENESLEITDISAIIFATGFSPSHTLSFLPDSVLQTLSYDPNCSMLPVLLDANTTSHRLLPDLGFVGFYRGPYWGVIEMQARFLASLFLGDKSAASVLEQDEGGQGDMEKLRNLWYKDPEQVAQFPMGDYAYLMEYFREVNGTSISGVAGTGPVVPSRYLGPQPTDAQTAESNAALKPIATLFEDTNVSGDGGGTRFVSRAIFRALQGNWKLSRKMISSIAIYPSGAFIGEARFLPRKPTEEEYDSEYLYIEEGDFETETGMKFRANRRYV
jgi:hypothetical protein